MMVWVGTSLLTRGVVFQWASSIKTDRRSDLQGGSSTYRQTPTYTTLFIDQAIKLDEPCSRRYETEIMSKRR